MTAAPPDTVTRWARKGTPSVECREDVLAELRALPARQAESGGVLFGTRDAGAIRVTGQAAVPLEHVHGPSFVLSKRDEMAFRATMKPANGTEPVGIYIVHRRPTSAVSEMDAAAAGKLFRDVPTVLLMVQPESVVCFVRGAGEFVELGVTAPSRGAEDPVPRARPRRTLVAAAAGMVAAGLAAAGGWMWLRPASAPPPPAPAAPVARELKPELRELKPAPPAPVKKATARRAKSRGSRASRSRR